MNKEKLMIGINLSNQESLIGPVMVSKVIVPTDFFRKESWIKFKSNLNTLENNILFERSVKKVITHEIEPIQVYEIVNNKIEVYRCVISLLNYEYEFWNNEIYIYTEEDSEEFIKKLINVFPHNLKSKIDVTKFNIYNTNNKILSLSKCYAEYYLNKEMMDIKSIWGDFGTGKKEDKKTLEFIKNSPKCPHIRKKENE